MTTINSLKREVKSLKQAIHPSIKFWNTEVYHQSYNSVVEGFINYRRAKTLEEKQTAHLTLRHLIEQHILKFPKCTMFGLTTNTQKEKTDHATF
ncbi:MAG: hypothetical protein LBE76_05500 [Nitrososphaerota archaeon]|jgi:copper oxidase (laccase) domain-containing protein|nr:hypothetical protein [Nitrososphaerota archaeon]